MNENTLNTRLTMLDAILNLNFDFLVSDTVIDDMQECTFALKGDTQAISDIANVVLSICNMQYHADNVENKLRLFNSDADILCLSIAHFTDTADTDIDFVVITDYATDKQETYITDNNYRVIDNITRML